MYRACRERDWETAQEAMREVNEFLVHVALPLVRKGHLDPVRDKILAGLTGFLEGSRSVRPPRQTIGNEEMEAVWRRSGWKLSGWYRGGS